VFALAAVSDGELLAFAEEIADEYETKKKEEEEPEPETPVIFRQDRDGSITAVFPTLPASVTGYEMTCYAHVGQHSGCSYEWYRTTRPVKDNEAAKAELRAELESIGYRLREYKMISSRLRHEFNRARAAL
jgi:Rieske Fe-S protein